MCKLYIGISIAYINLEIYSAIIAIEFVNDFI